MKLSIISCHNAWFMATWGKVENSFFPGRIRFTSKCFDFLFSSHNFSSFSPPNVFNVFFLLFSTTCINSLSGAPTREEKSMATSRFIELEKISSLLRASFRDDKYFYEDFITTHYRSRNLCEGELNSNFPKSRAESVEIIKDLRLNFVFNSGSAYPHISSTLFPFNALLLTRTDLNA